MTATATPPATRLLEIEPGEFAAHFARTPYRIRHHLADHPLLTVEAVAELAERLPDAQVEHNSGQIAEVLPGGVAPQVAATPGEVARGIETNGAWMVLKNIEADSAYNALLDACLDEVAPLVSGREGGMSKREGFIFLSAPRSVTPAHVDPEHNFLLQVRGRKEMNIGLFDDAQHEQRELERHYDGGHRNMDRLPARPELYDLHPGDGVYVPVHAPHWVKNGETVSVSLSITFRTPTTQRAQHVHVANSRLRGLGLTPTPPGRRPRLDVLKAGATRGVQGVQRRSAQRLGRAS